MASGAHHYKGMASSKKSKKEQNLEFDFSVDMHAKSGRWTKIAAGITGYGHNGTRYEYRILEYHSLFFTPQLIKILRSCTPTRKCLTIINTFLLPGITFLQDPNFTHAWYRPLWLL